MRIKDGVNFNDGEFSNLIRHEYAHAVDNALSGNRKKLASIAGKGIPKLGLKPEKLATGAISNHPDVRRAFETDVARAKKLAGNNKTPGYWATSPSEGFAEVFASRTGPVIPGSAGKNIKKIREVTPSLTRVLRRLLARNGTVLKCDGEQSLHKVGGEDDAGYLCGRIERELSKGDGKAGATAGGNGSCQDVRGAGDDTDVFVRDIQHDSGGTGSNEEIKGNSKENARGGGEISKVDQAVYTECHNVSVRQLSKSFLDFNSALAKSDPAKKPTVLEIADQHVDTLAERIAKALGWLADQGDTVAAAAADGPQAAAQAVPVADFGSRMDNAFETITNIVETAGDNLPPAGSGDKKIDFSFDVGSAKVQDYLDSTKMGLIQQITDDQRQTIHDIVQDAMTNGDSTDAMKRRIRDVIGLTDAQGQNVENYRQELENLDPGALKRALRDGRMDGPIGDAIESGEALDPEYIDKAVSAYKDRYVNYRSSVIAKTESIRSAVAGARLGMEQMLDDPEMDGFTVLRTWKSAHDSKVRPDHKLMDGQSVVGMDAEYELPDGGSIAYPLSPDAPADQTIQCRCHEAYKVIKDTET